MIKHLMMIAAAMTFLAGAAQANDAGDPDENCDGSTQEMVDCLAAKTARWDKRMTIAYQQALKDASSDRQRNQLRAAQRLWIQYRDANCLYYELGEGTIARLNSNSCMLSLTEARARELENASQQ